MAYDMLHYVIYWIRLYVSYIAHFREHPATAQVGQNPILWFVIVLQDETWVGHCFDLWDVS